VYLFLLVGLAAIGLEILNPGGFAAGIAGAVLVLLGLTGMALLPFEWAGIAFLALAVLLFAAEILVAGFGAFAAGGVAALVIGGLMMFDDPGAEISPVPVVLSALVIGAGFVTLARLGVRSRRAALASGPETMLGAVGEVRGAIGAGAAGQVFVNGELWQARTAGGNPLERGEPVRVVAMQDLTLTVESNREGDRA
jgi:membrane-bound serine protease (ClpP class)